MGSKGDRIWAVERAIAAARSVARMTNFIMVSLSVSYKPAGLFLFISGRRGCQRPSRSGEEGEVEEEEEEEPPRCNLPVDSVSIPKQTECDRQSSAVPFGIVRGN
jgi:hypothetical protein